MKISSKALLVGLTSLFLIFFNTSFSKINLVQAETTETTDSIDATVKTSVCGNGEIEGGEDCEGEDLNNQTCISLGYASGDLSCDIACSFDTSECIAPSPTPTPTPSPSSSPSSTSTPTSSPTTETQTLIASPVPTEAAGTPTPIVALLPSLIRSFDQDASGRIEINELLGAVRGWLDEWQKGPDEPRACDLNHDGECSLIDFSVLLYYIER
jgi:hypothetical protein